MKVARVKAVHNAPTGRAQNGSLTADRPIADRTFEITFLDPGVEVFAFTFG